MDEIKVNEEMTEMAMIANDMATLKAMDPEAYESVWQNALRVAKEDLYKKFKKEESLGAAITMKILDMVCNECVTNPFTMVDLMKMMQEDKES